MTAMRTPAAHALRVVSLVALFIAPATPASEARVTHVGGLAITTSAASASNAADTPLFFPVVTSDSGGSQASVVAIADVNGDHKPDVVVANCGACTVVRPGASISVMLGNGDGSLQPAFTFDSGGIPVFVAVADVNHDVKPDLVVANRCGNQGCRNKTVVSVLLGRGDGTFESAATFGSGGQFASSVAVADVNRDGDVDVVVANNCADPDCNGSVGVLLGKGDGTFRSVVTYRSGTKLALAVAIADVDGDGGLDVVVTGQDVSTGFGRVSALLGNGDGIFRTAVTFSIGSGAIPQAVVVADVNGDSKADLVVADGACCGGRTGGASVLLGNGDGTFKPAVIYEAGARGFGTSVAVADVNDDGALDLITAEQCAAFNCLNQGVVDVRLGRGNGTFQAPITFGSGGFLTNWVAAGDLNDDGGRDLVVANQCADNSSACLRSSVGVLLNNAVVLDTTPPSITVAATPNILWPPNGKSVHVTVSGAIIDSASGINASTVAFDVRDEYGGVQPRGSIQVNAAGHYAFRVLLPARRRGADQDGRRYTIGVTASDNAGNRAAASAIVIVPHNAPDRRR